MNLSCNNFDSENPTDPTLPINDCLFFKVFGTTAITDGNIMPRNNNDDCAFHLQQSSTVQCQGRYLNAHKQQQQQLELFMRVILRLKPYNPHHLRQQHQQRKLISELVVIIGQYLKQGLLYSTD